MCLGYLELHLWSCGGRRLRARFRSRLAAFDPSVRFAFGRPCTYADERQSQAFADISKKAVCCLVASDNVRSRHCFYILMHGVRSTSGDVQSLDRVRGMVLVLSGAGKNTCRPCDINVLAMHVRVSGGQDIVCYAKNLPNLLLRSFPLDTLMLPIHLRLRRQLFRYVVLVPTT